MSNSLANAFLEDLRFDAIRNPLPEAEIIRAHQVDEIIAVASESELQAHNYADSELIEAILSIGENDNQTRVRVLHRILVGGTTLDEPELPFEGELTIHEIKLMRIRHWAYTAEFWKRALPKIDESFGLGLIGHKDQEE
jgi:hypothetical protein